MAVSLKSLVTPPTQDEVVDAFLVILGVVGFPITSWQSGGVARTLLKILASGLVSVSTLTSLIAAGGFLGYATGDWLSLLASQVFFVTRYDATFAVGSITLACSVSGGPYTIVPGQLSFGWGTLVYTNTNGGVLNTSGTLALTFQATQAGAIYNAPDGAINVLLTPLAGVSISGNATVTTQGTDAEADGALILRCAGQWGNVGSAANDAGYGAWARSASIQVTRVSVQDNTPIDGQVTVLVAGPAGPVAGGVITTVATYINGPPTIRRALGVKVFVQNATARNVAATATLYARSAYPNAAAQVIGAWLAYASTLPIATVAGGYTVTGGVSVLMSQLTALAVGVAGTSAAGVPGVTNIAFPVDPTVNLLAGEVAVIVPTLTVVYV